MHANDALVSRVPGGALEAALALDWELVVLAGADARCRLVRARIVAQIIRRRAWRDRGFVRLGDFARERLGVSPRGLEEDARMIRAVETLPAFRAALESGRLPWSRARVIVRAATPGNEARLLRDSAAVAYRDLEAWTRNFRTSAERDAPTDAAVVAASPDAWSGTTQADADDPLVRWSIALSRRGRRMWRAACELAARSAGSTLSASQVLELVAAEASQASVFHDGLEGAGSLSASQASSGPLPEDHDERLRARVREREAGGRRRLLDFLAETGAAEGFAWLAPASCDPGPAEALQALQGGLDQADPCELERRLHTLRAITQKTDARLAALLRAGIDRLLFRELGFASVKLYVESRLGMSARSAWDLVAIERDSWRQSKLLREAWKAGRITSLQARALLRIVTPENAEAWLDRAREVTLRRLEDEVTWAAGVDLPSASVLPPEADADVRRCLVAGVSLAEVQNRARGDAGDSSLEAADAAPLELYAPVSVLVLVESALDRLQRPGEARWQTFERMIALSLCEWLSTPRHRDPVFERDGWRCAVPACTSRCNLHDHHVRFRSEGGDGEQSNRITVCAAHHLHGIHAGIIHADGRAPDAIRWQTPFGTLVGDRYVRAAAV